MSHDVEGRRKDLLNPYQRDVLGQHLDQVKTLAPILICSMKIFIQILGTDAQGANKGMEEAVENRNYLAKRMTEEIMEIINILEDSAQADEMNAKVSAGVNGSKRHCNSKWLKSVRNSFEIILLHILYTFEAKSLEGAQKKH